MSTIDDTINISDKEEITTTGPGQRLRLARELAVISKQEVAKRLHLRTSIIEALENDDYSASPKFVFIRGYLRSYAKLLHLPADEIVGTFNALNLEDAVSDIPSFKPTQVDVPTGEKKIRMVTYTVIFSIVVLVGLWWQLQRGTGTIHKPLPQLSEVSTTVKSNTKPRANRVSRSNSESTFALDDNYT